MVILFGRGLAQRNTNTFTKQQNSFDEDSSFSPLNAFTFWIERELTVVYSILAPIFYSFVCFVFILTVRSIRLYLLS